MGQTGQLAAVERTSSTATQDVTGTATWQSSNPAVATVSASGLVTAIAAGSSVVTASSQSVVGSLIVSVVANTVTGILIVGPSSLLMGQTIDLTAAASTTSGMQVLTSGVAWQSSNPGVAVVSNTGTLTALAPGTTSITATYAGVTGTLRITVTSQTVARVALFGTPTVLSGTPTQLIASATLADGTSQIVTNAAVWQSSNTAAATVSSSGLVTWLATGTTTITATYLGVTGSMDIAAN